MGYRSDVAIMLYPQGYKPVDFAVLKLWFEETFPHETAVDEWDAKIDMDGGYISVCYYGVKWYTDFGHVKAVEEALRKFDAAFNASADNEEDATAAYEMVRIGEELNDIEHDSSGWHNLRLYVDRRITFEEEKTDE